VLARPWLIWWVLCIGFWLLLVDRLHVAEVLTGVGIAAVAASVATIVRRRRLAVLRFDARWLLAAWRPLLGVVTDLVPLARAVVERVVLRRDVRGRLVEVPFAAVGDGAREVSSRAITEALGSLAPNTIVVAIDTERAVLLAHQLRPTADVARAAAPLPETRA
jgi:multisubunit Na+/H+ antiporter MnhE subunit